MEHDLNRKLTFGDRSQLFWNGPKLARIGLLMVVPGLLSAMFFYAVAHIAYAPYREVDYDEVVKNGDHLHGTVTETIIDAGQLESEPVVVRITYEFNDKGSARTDSYTAAFSDDAVGYDVGDRIEIAVLGDDTVVKGLTPWHRNISFPILFYLVPGVCFVLALASLGVCLWTARNRAALYRHGHVRDAAIVSMAVKKRRLTDDALVVHYQYTDWRGEKTFGYSEGNGALLRERKNGDTVLVLVADDNSDSCVVPKHLAQKNGWGIAP
jgi:hypothetical protein